jgi:amino acid transporter
MMEDDGLVKMESHRTYPASTSTVTPLLTVPTGVKSLHTTRVFDSFRAGPEKEHAYIPTLAVGENGRYFDTRAAAYNTANTGLVRKLKGRHLQMIAIGGSIGKTSRTASESREYISDIKWQVPDCSSARARR